MNAAIALPSEDQLRVPALVVGLNWAIRAEGTAGSSCIRDESGAIMNIVMHVGAIWKFLISGLKIVRLKLYSWWPSMLRYGYREGGD